MSVGQDILHDPVKHLSHGKEVSAVHPMHNVYKLKERMISSNKYIQPFTSLSFGSQAIQLTIPNAQVIQGITCNIVFKGSNVADALCPMPGYALIDRMEYRVAGSTLYTITGYDMWQILRASCSTQDQVNELISLAGGATATTIGTSNLETNIWIPLAWSRINSAFSEIRYGIDTSILNQPIQVFLYLKQSTQVYTNNTGANTALVSASYHIYGADYMNKEERLVPKPGEFFNYPCHYFQSFKAQSQTAANSSTVLSCNLTSFRKGNLIGMIIYCIDDANLNGVNSFKLNTLSDVQLLFNGVSLYQSIGTDWRLMNLQHNLSPAQYVAYSQTNRVIEVVFSNMHHRYKQFDFNGGLNLNSQTLNLNYKVTDSTNSASINCIYIYDASWVYNQDNAELVL